MHLLTDEAVYASVVERVQTWEGNEETRRADSADLRSARTDARSDAKDQLADSNHKAHMAQQIEDAVGLLLPEDMDANSRALFMEDAKGDLIRHIKSTPGFVVNEQFLTTIPDVLGTRLRLYGVAQGQSSPANDPTPSKEDRLADEAKTTQDRIKRSIARRKGTGAVAGAGAGAPAAEPVRAPKGAGIKDTIKHLREKGFGRGGWSG